MNVIVFANGVLPKTKFKLAPHAYIIAADGGAHHCLQLGIIPDTIIGDFDSLSNEDMAYFAQAGTFLKHYPADKDETDLELALNHAVERGAEHITLYGLLGGRWDMSFANILLLAAPRYSGIHFQVVAEGTRLYILRGGETLDLSGKLGDTVSVIPVTPNTRGLSYSGLTWSLKNAHLPIGSPRGVSNRLESDTAEITLEAGVVLVVHLLQNSEEPA
jgi:thiamine pyrophosphokinase